MNKTQVLETVDKIFSNVFDCKNPFTIDEILTKFAFDVKLPQQVNDSITGEVTWATSVNPTKYIREENTWKWKSWEQPKQEIENLDQLVTLWNQLNYRTTERVYDSTNVSESDTIYRSENIYRSCDSSDCKNLVFSDGCQGSEYLLASQRSGHCSFCIRCDDSSGCSNSYNVSCSAKISNSLFIEDCGSLHECMFCAHISNKKYCICNMQFEKEEYFEIKKEIIKWIMNS